MMARRFSVRIRHSPDAPPPERHKPQRRVPAAKRSKWSQRSVRATNTTTAADTTTSDDIAAPDNAQTPGPPPTPQPQIDIGDHVIGRYQEALFVGRVLDQEVDEIHVDFMVEHEKCKIFSWPSAKDRLLMKPEDIVATKIDAPTPLGRFKRSFTFSEGVLTMLRKLY